MQTFSPEEDATRQSLSDALDTTDVAINRYRLPADEGLPGGLHTHLSQEEVFVVLDGTVRFETLAEPVVVDAGAAVRFTPGEYQTGLNDGDSPAVVLALGAPKASGQLRVPLDCPNCGHRGLSPKWQDGEVMLGCPDCDADHRTRGCPECEREEMQAAPGGSDGETVVVCPDCGAVRSEPQWV